MQHIFGQFVIILASFSQFLIFFTSGNPGNSHSRFSHDQSRLVMTRISLFENNPVPIVRDWHILSHDQYRDRDHGW